MEKEDEPAQDAAQAGQAEEAAAGPGFAGSGAGDGPEEWNEVESVVPQVRGRQPKQLSRLSRDGGSIQPIEPRPLPDGRHGAQQSASAAGRDWLTLDMEGGAEGDAGAPDAVELQWVAYALNYICLAKARRGLIAAEAEVRLALQNEDFSRFYRGLTLNDFFTDIVVLHGVRLHAQAQPVDLAVLPHSHPYLQWLSVCDREERCADTAVGGGGGEALPPRCILGQFECFTQPSGRRQPAPVALPERLAMVERAHVDALIDHIAGCMREVYGVDVAARHSGAPG
jgi:hypothetical protein